MATSGTSVLKEFLVKIGFSVDETKFRHFQEAMRTTAKNAVEMSRTAAVATAGLSAMVTAAAKNLEGLYFATRRTGAGAAELKELGFAAEQIGVSAEQARGAVEALAASRRTNPGLNGILGGMGIDPRQTDNAKVLLELVGKLRQMPYYQATQIAGMFGINEQTLVMMEQGLPQMQKYLAMRQKMFGAAGLSGSQIAARSHEFMTHFRTLEAAAGNLADIMAYRLEPAFEKVSDWLTAIVMWFTRADKATHGWSSRILGLAVALKGTTSALGVAGKMLGRGGAGIAAGTAAGGEAAETGGVLAAIMGAINLPIIIGLVVAAVAAYFAFSKHGREMVSHAAHSIKNATVSAWKASGIGPSLTRMVQSFEGHAKYGYGLYRDAAGHLTAGFGHLVRPGEDLAGLNQQGATSLLGRDLAKARAAVLRFVKVALTGNQLDALTDFEFNVGQRNFARSKLLRLLNGGNYLAAADQFQYWNHALVNGHMMALAGLTARRAAEANLFRAPDRAVQVTQTNEYHVTSTDPRGAGAEIERRQARMTADLVRNMQGAYR